MAQGAEIAPGFSLHPSTLLKLPPAGNWIPHCPPTTDSPTDACMSSSSFQVSICKGGIRPKATEIHMDTKPRP